MGLSYLHDKKLMVLSRLDFYDKAVKELLVHKWIIIFGFDRVNSLFVLLFT